MPSLFLIVSATAIYKMSGRRGMAGEKVFMGRGQKMVAQNCTHSMTVKKEQIRVIMFLVE